MRKQGVCLEGRRGRRSRSAALAGLVSAAALSLAAVAFAATSIVSAGNLTLEIDSSVSPKALPKKTLAPIAFKLGTSVATKDGKHVPPATSFRGEIDRNSALNPTGLPVCKPGQLQARPTAAAKAACGGALIGQGFAEAEVEFAESAPFDARGPLLMFNGGRRGGEIVILVHVYANVPSPTAFVTEISVSKVDNGRYGLEFDARIPVIAGGAGSLTRFWITFRKAFTYRGQRQSYFLARCPAGRLFGHGKLAFADGTLLRATAALPCIPKG
jgi:hypothetical protein